LTDSHRGDFKSWPSWPKPDKEQIVVLLGQNKRPFEVVAIMREERGVETSVDQVLTYDPRSSRFKADREKWTPIFEAAVEAYANDIKAVVVAKQTWRLNELHDLYKKAKAAKNIKLAAELLEQIARETGGNFTNARELNINDARKARELSPEDRAAALGALLSEAIAVKREQPTTH
jgi:hypothetical protein